MRSASSATVFTGYPPAFFNGFGAPCADCSWNHRYDVEQVQGPALEVLAGDVFECLPPRPQVHAVANLGIARHRPDLRILEVRDQLRNRVHRDDGVGVDAHVNLFINAIERVIERCGLAAIRLFQHLYAASPDFGCIGLARHFGSAILRAVIDHDYMQIVVVRIQH